MATDILLYKNEFWTVVATGESATSLRGLSRLSGIPIGTLHRWFDSDLFHEGVPKELQHLRGKALYLTHEIKRRGNTIKPILMDVASEIVEYAAFDLNKAKAREVFRAFAKIGATSFAHGETGWLPKEKQASQDSRNEINRLIKDADPWKQLYSAATCDKVRRWYFPRDFFWKFAYDWMTTEEIQFLNSHNPVDPNNIQRGNRIHQHLSEQTRDRLTPEIAGLCVLIESATSKQDFETRYNRAKGYDQKEAF